MKDNKSREEKFIDRDEEILFEVIGDYGPWQRNVFMALFFSHIIAAWQNMSITFLAPNQDFHCITANYSDLNEAGIHLPNISRVTNVSQGRLNECEFIIDTHQMINNTYSKKSIVSCTSWEYDQSEFSHTIVSEWNLVCKREWLISFAKSIFMIGFLASTLVWGPFSDRWGRFPTLMICWIIMCFFGILSAFSTSYSMFAILRFWTAFGYFGFTTTGFILLMEVTGPKRRTEIGMAVHLGSVIGMVALLLITSYVKDWAYFQLCISLPALGLAFIYWSISESPRWLLAHQKRKEFEDVIAKAIRKNGQSYPDDIESIMPFSAIKKRNADIKTMTFVDLVRTPQMRKYTFNLAALWGVTAFVYYALTYNTNDLGGNTNLNFFLTGAVEIPSYIIVLFTVRTAGRIKSIFGSMILVAVCYIPVILASHDLNWLIITFTMIGKSCICGTFAILYLYTAEVFPTVIRNISLGTCSAFARVGSITAPFVRELSKVTEDWVPNVLIACLVTCSAFLVFFLPETKGKKIPDTIEEVEDVSSSDATVKYMKIPSDS